MPEPTQNLEALHCELEWLTETIQQSMTRYFKQDGHDTLSDNMTPPYLDPANSLYARQIQDWQLSTSERLALALALAPHLRPEALDPFLILNSGTGHSFTQFGGTTQRHFNGFLPTGQTLAFLLSANDPPRILEALRILGPQHRFSAEKLLALEPRAEQLPLLAGVLIMSHSWVRHLLSGEPVGKS